MFRGGIGAPEILLILGVVILLFGAKKLPDLARGSGRALRIFKSETKGLVDSDKDTHDDDHDDHGDHDDRDRERRAEHAQGLPSAEAKRHPEEQR